MNNYSRYDNAIRDYVTTIDREHASEQELQDFIAGSTGAVFALMGVENAVDGLGGISGYVREMLYRPVILVGRHASDLPAYVQVMKQENIQWSLNADECRQQLTALLDQAKKLQFGVLFQNIPGILMATMTRYLNGRQGQGYDIHVGIIISVPGPRLASVSKLWTMPASVYADGSGLGADEMRAIVQQVVAHANGRAKFETSGTGEPDGFTVTVDPVSEFKFDHIEWL